jgi:hypothetical protein
MDELIDLANQRSRATGENAAEELLQMMLKCGIAEEVPAEPRPGTKPATPLSS